MSPESNVGAILRQRNTIKAEIVLDLLPWDRGPEPIDHDLELVDSASDGGVHHLRKFSITTAQHTLFTVRFEPEHKLIERHAKQ